MIVQDAITRIDSVLEDPVAFSAGSTAASQGQFCNAGSCHLQLRQPKECLEDVSLSIGSGQTVALHSGPSGGSKSTLAALIAASSARKW